MIYLMIPLLIIILLELVGVRKENEEAELNKIKAKYKLEDIEEELRLEQKSNASNQGWNTKYRNKINKLEYDLHEFLWKMNEQAKTIKSLSCAVDESHIVVEAIANNKSKKARLELANKYKFNEK